MQTLENSMVIGAQRAYEAACPESDDSVLLDVVIQLEVALTDKAKLPPVIAHAKEHIFDCALDEYDVIQNALMESLTDADEAGTMIRQLMAKHVRNYAEGHLSALAEYFGIDRRSALLREQAA